MKTNTSLFIGGVGHSGTTLLFRVLSKSKESFSPLGESRLIETLGLINKEYLIKNESERVKFLVDKLYYGYQVKKSHYDSLIKNGNPLYFSELNEIEPKSILQDLNQIIHKISLELDRPLFVEKTPSNVFHVDRILRSINNAKVLIIQRDVRDVVSSLKSRYLTLKNKPEVFAHNYNVKKLDKDYNLVVDSIMWNKSINSWKKIDSDNLKIIRYEDFVTNPVNETKMICSWLGIEYHSGMLQLKWRNSSDRNLAQEKGVSPSSINKFKSNLSAAEIALIQIISGKKLKSLGYELEDIPLEEKMKVTYLIPKELIKIPIRFYKRFRLMKFSYFLNYCFRVLNKLLKV